MNYIQATINRIYSIESTILKSKTYSPIWIGVNLKDLRDVRRELYYPLATNAQDKTEIKETLFKEYIKYCKFIQKLLATKKLSATVFDEVLHHFFNDYDMIKPIDTDLAAYAFTLSTMNSLKHSLKNSTLTRKNVRIKDVDTLLQHFIETTAYEVKLNP